MVIIFGLGPSAHVFTKMLMAVIKFLRSAFSILIVAYIHDLLIQAADAETCSYHAHITVLGLQCLDYRFNFYKSLLTPSKFIKHVGILCDSESMTLPPPGQGGQDYDTG